MEGIKSWQMRKTVYSESKAGPYLIVNSMLRSAYYKKSGKNNITKKRENVEETLLEIQKFLRALDLASPF